MYYFHAVGTLRPNWPPPESALMFPPASITDDEGTYDSVNGKPGCWLENSGMSVNYNFFCGKTIQWPAKPPTGAYRVQVSAEMLLQMVHQHLHRSLAFYGEHKGLLLFRRHALSYLKFQNLPRAVRTSIIFQKDARSFLSLLDAYYAGFAIL